MFKRGYVTIVFDDGYELVYENAVPLLRKYKIPAVFALPINESKLEKTEFRKVRPWHKWLHLMDEGFEIASHSVNHPNLTKLSAQELEYELSDSSNKLKATTIVYPGGAVDDKVAAHAREFYSAGRTVHYGFESVPPREPMRLKSYNFSRKNFSVFKANYLALYAWLTNSWLIETYHMVDDNELDMVHSVKTKDLDRHLRFLKRLPVVKATIGDLINS
jgi:peptidoglycan/xylan/chitin deacetylase (PgdA/CDA1 family)